MEVFAWSPYNILGVDLNFIMHNLNVDPKVVPKKQRPRRLVRPYAEAVREEMEKLKKSGGHKRGVLSRMAG